MRPFHRLWRKAVRRASNAVLRRSNLSPAALLGRQGEEAAYWHLREHGFVMVERNYRPQGLRGEIDLIGWDGDILVFIEVKTLRTTGTRMPETAVDREKQRHLIAAARQYRTRSKHSATPYRFDIVSIVSGPDASGSGIELHHYRDAFREADLPSQNV